MLQLTNITKQYDDGKRTLTVLDKLSLQVADGEFIAITGESGSGKTTLLSILGTLIRADEGIYLLNGRDIRTTDLDEVRNREIGIVFQDHRLLPQFSVLQNILLPVLAHQTHCSDETLTRAEQLMSFVGISELKDASVNQLSGGEKARVAICRALINQPSILLADEPTGQLDHSNAQTIARLFQQINAELHTTIIMVTHSGEMSKTAQKVYTLKDGKLV